MIICLIHLQQSDPETSGIERRGSKVQISTYHQLGRSKIKRASAVDFRMADCEVEEDQGEQVFQLVI